MAIISASEQLIIFCGRNKFNFASFDVNSGLAIGKDAIGCLSLQLLTRSLLKIKITWAQNYNASLNLKQMDKKLNKLDSLEEKVSKFDSELKKLWVFVHDEFKENKDAMSKVTERIDGLEFSLGLAQEQITQMTNDKAKVNDTQLYVQSQSMRNNLIFTGITEDVNEKPDVTESKLRTFMVEKLKLARDIVDGFQLERAHRMGDNSSFGRAGRPRSIVAKFLRFKDREVVRQARSKLKGTGYFVNEEFPKEIADRRKDLLPKMRQAIRDGKRAWISYDTLYIDGRPIRPESH